MNQVSNAVAIAVSESKGKRAKPLQKNEIGIRRLAFIKCALTEKDKTLKKIADILKFNNLSASAVNIKNVKNIKKEISELRGSRNRSRPLKPKSTLTTRLYKIREDAITEYAFKLLRWGAPAGTYVTLNFADSNLDVDYRVVLDKVYRFYRGSSKKWPANSDHHIVSVPADWRTRVLKKGLAELGGMLTLDAMLIESKRGVEIYAATWVIQERGYSVKVERGIIAISNTGHFHAATIEAAIAGLETKTHAMQTAEDMKLSIENFVGKYAKFQINVSLDDAQRSGSCEYGIRSWCGSVGIDINLGAVPINDILAAFRKLPLAEVRKAVIYSVRKSRHNLV